MRLITAYAPGSFLKPCVVISTLFNDATRETAVVFVEALNQEHALGVVFGDRQRTACTEWIITQRHETRQAAIDYHLALVEPFINGGSTQEWERGWEPYLALYERWCPAAFKRQVSA